MGGVTIISVILAMLSALFAQWKFGNYLYWVADSNKIMAVVVAISSFLWFKNLNIPQSKIINAIGGSTFGVLLIHANSDTMRTWLWKDIVNCVGQYDLPLAQLTLYSIGVVLLIFTVCILIDYLRIVLLEKPFFMWYDNHLDKKLNGLFYKTEEY